MDKKKTEILKEKYAGSFDGKKKYKPFATSRYLIAWNKRNCGTCKKGYDNKKCRYRCGWELALCKASITDMKITQETAKAIGFLDSEGCDLWECPGWARR